ncbi:anti-Muellerian hormone type-2 receptor-like isoform X2 [Festucalex cinctus]
MASPEQSGFRATMIRHRWLLFMLMLECIFPRASSHSPDERRQCAFQVKEQNRQYLAAGNVSDSVQVCEHTRCCVGYFVFHAGQLEVDALACDIAEKSCLDATCKAQLRFNKQVVKCVCSTDLCNRNITWSEEAPEVDGTWLVVIVATMLILCLAIVAVQWRCLWRHKKLAQDAAHNTPASPCQTPKIDAADIELQQIVARGHFATVWRGTYQGSVVAVKVFPAAAQHVFNSEKEVYGLPLMRHAGIIRFLGIGRRSEDDSWLLVMQFAEYWLLCSWTKFQGSLHSFLDLNTSSWPSSLKMCLSLSQGLAYLHSCEHTQGHKRPVAHRDLSSFNVLVRADGACALCDFGSSVVLRSDSDRHQTGNAMSYSQAACALHYIPPEILEGYVNLTSSWFLHGDIYALSLVLWEICTRCSDLFEGEIRQDGAVPQHLLPYERELGGSMTRESLTIHVTHMEKRPSIPEHWQRLRQGSALQDLLTECWDVDPDARLPAQCVVNRLVSLQSHSLV